MQALTFDELDANREAFDAEVRRTPDIDRFCSSSPWIIPASRAMMPPREPFIYRGDQGYLALALGEHAEVGRYIQPLEAAWGFASGLIGRMPFRVATLLADAVQSRKGDWDMLLLGGLTVGSRIWHALIRTLGPRYGLFEGQVTRRHRASLEGGIDGFLSRRTREMRKGLRKAARAAEGLGLRFERIPPPADCDALYERILAIERRSWKGMEGGGIAAEPMTGFYRLMLPRLVRGGQFRLIIATQDAEDVGFILGAVEEGIYRGLQFSFDDRFRGVALGNLLQMAQIEDACREGVHLWDLGSDAPYKERWAEQRFDTLTMVVTP